MNVSKPMPRTLIVIGLAYCLSPSCAHAQQRPQAPRVESVVPSARQPQENDLDVIWYDDFDRPARQAQYPEKSGVLTDSVRFGSSGKSLRLDYPHGSRGTGGRKIFFGDSPTYRGHVLRPDESFEDVYWRIYVKHPVDWTGGGPAKMSRATSLVPPGWRQAMIAHVWSSGESLTLDPASGVQDGQVVTTRYNDFPNLNWLGNRPASQFRLHGDDGRGWWVCVEARAKLNRPGKKDGLNQLWIDGKLEAERHDLDWRGSFTSRGINAVFLEAYWNQGSPVDQARWFDNFVVSTKPIGPVRCARNPMLLKTPYNGPGHLHSWQVEIAKADSTEEVIWRADSLSDSDRVTVSGETGQFINSLESSHALAADQTYVVRLRQQSSNGMLSPWSPWHQAFRTLDEESASHQDVPNNGN